MLRTTIRPTRLAPLRRRVGCVYRRETIWAAIALALTGFRARAAAADAASFVVIVHPKNPVRRATRELLTDLFLKRVTQWAHGPAVRPVDLRVDSTVRADFSERVLRRSVAAVKRYWQQRIFSGRDVPPPELASDSEVVGHVLSDIGAIGYVSRFTALGGARALPVE